MNRKTYGLPVIIFLVRKKRARSNVFNSAKEDHTEHNGDDRVTADGVEEDSLDSGVTCDFFAKITRIQSK